MSTPQAAPDPQQKARRLWRWTWGMVALAFALMVVGGAVFKPAPYLFSEALSNVFIAAAVLGVASYFVVRGEPAYRKARANWIAALVVLLGVAPALFVAQRAQQRLEGEKLQAIVKEMAGQFTKADRDYADNLTAEHPEVALELINSGRIANAAIRDAAGATLASSIKVVDDALARRGRIPEETIARVLATAAGAKAKEAMVAVIREAAAAPPPLAVQMMDATRAFLGKAAEIVAHVDKHAAGVSARDGQLEFADSAAVDIFNALRAELAGLRQEMQRLAEQAKAK